jgi:hypothetical protein
MAASFPTQALEDPTAQFVERYLREQVLRQNV